MKRTESITVYRIRGQRSNGEAYAEWRWRWKAANGKTKGASTEGYVSRARAIANLVEVTGGVVTLTYRLRSEHGDYAQGEWIRGDRKIFVSVTP